MYFDQYADFEDAIQIACATDQRLDAILTRDTQDFANASVPALSVQDFLQRLGE